MTPLFGPGWGNYAIRGIVETELPAPVAFRPETPGWWVLLAFALLALLRFAWRRWRHWRRNGYRRAALQRLERLQARFDDGDADALLELAPLLRATAVHASNRRDSAAASGEAWARELARLAPDLPPLPVSELHRLAYAPAGARSTVDPSALFEQLHRWIRTHGTADA